MPPASPESRSRSDDSTGDDRRRDHLEGQLLDLFVLADLAQHPGQRHVQGLTERGEQLGRGFLLAALDWTAATRVRGEAARKDALASAYEKALRAKGLLTGKFGVQVRNATARYYLVFATHSEHGLSCWNPVTWKLDSYSGQSASAASVGQPDLFGTSAVQQLKDVYSAHAGQEATWSTLLGEAITAGYLAKHVREALDELGQEGLAFRVHPTKARSAWPEGCRVRFYLPQDAEAPVVEPLDESDPPPGGAGG